MGFFSLGQSLKPVGDFIEALFPGAFRHTGIHIGVFVGLTGDRRLQVLVGGADGLTGRRIACLFEKFEVAVGMAGLAFRG